MTRRTRDNSDLIIENYTFQKVADFKYLGANINQHNNMHNEIYMNFMCHSITSNMPQDGHPCSRLSKERLHLSFLWPVLTCTCQTRSITKGNKEKIACFKRRVLRNIYKPILENEIYRRTNRKVQQIYQKSDINVYIQIYKYFKQVSRLNWLLLFFFHIWFNYNKLSKIEFCENEYAYCLYAALHTLGGPINAFFLGKKNGLGS